MAPDDRSPRSREPAPSRLRASLVVCALLGSGAVAHAQSAMDGFDPGTNGTIAAIAVQADGRIIVGGTFTMIGGGGTGHLPRHHIARLNVDGSVDPSFDPGANGPVLALVIQADAKIVVGGAFTRLGGGGTGTPARHHIGRLNADGTLDAGFDPGASDAVFALAIQPDAKILVGGDLSRLGGGGSGITARNRIGRLHADGSLDSLFDPGASDRVDVLAVQTNGRILVGGRFTRLGGGGAGAIPRAYLGRLHGDGSPDLLFMPDVHDAVEALALQPDGKVVVGASVGTTLALGRVNADGSLDVAFNPGANGRVRAIAVQADGRILIGGAFTMLGGGGTGTTVRSRIGRLNANGSLDGAFGAAANHEVARLALQSDGKVVVGGAFDTLGAGDEGSMRASLGRFTADGSLDDHFNPSANVSVHAFAVQPDGKILIGGPFFTLGGDGTPVITRNHIARLNADGAVDMAFNPGANDQVLAIAVQPDGDILIGGYFTRVGGGSGTTVRNRIARLRPDGSLDAGFDPGADGSVETLLVQPDGKILVGGNFTRLGGGGTGTTTRVRIGRLNADGSLDSAFNPGANGPVLTMLIQPDGRIAVGGSFGLLGGGGSGTTPRMRIGRLNVDGSIDPGFNPGANGVVSVLAQQADGRILVGGSFTMLGGGGAGVTPRAFIGRVNLDGSIDAGFDPGANRAVLTLAVQTDGRIVVGGDFARLGGGGTGVGWRSYIGRLEADGSLDTTFDPGANGNVYALALQPDGKILVGGFFEALGGGGTGTTTRYSIGRLAGGSAAGGRLDVTPDGTEISWSREGAGPEVSRVTFDAALDGGPFALLGDAVRIANRWHLAVPALPADRHLLIRARAYYPGGLSGKSTSIIESARAIWLGTSAFTDRTLTAGASVVRAVHLNELRSRIEALRLRARLPPIAWSEPISSGVQVNAMHVLELRVALQAVYAAAGRPFPVLTDPALTSRQIPIRAVHITELREAVLAVE